MREWRLTSRLRARSLASSPTALPHNQVKGKNFLTQIASRRYSKTALGRIQVDLKWLGTGFIGGQVERVRSR
jgi:hypothetical protein